MGLILLVVDSELGAHSHPASTHHDHPLVISHMKFSKASKQGHHCHFQLTLAGRSHFYHYCGSSCIQ